MTDEQQGREGKAGGPGRSPNAVEVDSVQSPSDFLRDSGKLTYETVAGYAGSEWFPGMLDRYLLQQAMTQVGTPEREAEK